MKNNYYIKQLIEISELLKVFLVVGIATLFYIFWYSLDIHKLFSFKHLYISIGHIGYIGLLLLPPYLVISNKIFQRYWMFFSTLALLDLQNLMYIVNEQKVHTNNYITAILLIYISIIILINKKFVNFMDIEFNYKSILLIFTSSLFFMCTYHGINILRREIPNKDRSCFLGSLECHHINYGILLLVLTPVFLNYILAAKNKKFKILGYIFIGFIYGTVFDESFYYLLQNVNDDNYFKIDVTFGSLVIMLLSLLTWIYSFRKYKNNVS